MSHGSKLVLDNRVGGSSVVSFVGVPRSDATPRSRAGFVLVEAKSWAASLVRPKTFVAVKTAIIVFPECRHDFAESLPARNVRNWARRSLPPYHMHLHYLGRMHMRSGKRSTHVSNAHDFFFGRV